MSRIDQEPTEAVVPDHRHRWTWITVVTIALVCGSALVAVPAIAQDGSTGSDPTTPQRPPNEKVVVCESGVVDGGDGVRTSSASVEWVTGDVSPPEGCRLG